MRFDEDTFDATQGKDKPPILEPHLAFAITGCKATRDGYRGNCPLCNYASVLIPRDGLSAKCLQGCDQEELMRILWDRLAEGEVERWNGPLAGNLVRASDLYACGCLNALWYGLYPGSVCLIVGETSVGKTTLFYNLIHHAANNEPLWGIPFGLGRPLRILYIDPETVPELAAAKMDRIGKEKSDNVVFYHGQDLDLSKEEHVQHLKMVIIGGRFDLVFLDPIANVFNTQDEDNNSEAARHMRSLVGLSRETGACIVAVHHTGKVDNGHYGRGASARLAAADTALVLRSNGQEDEDDTFTGTQRQREDICRLHLAKNRFGGRSSLYLRMVGDDQFELAAFEDWKNKPGKPCTKDKALEMLLKVLADGKVHSRSELMDYLKRANIGETNANNAIKALETEPGIIIVPGNNKSKSYQSKQTAFTMP